MLDGAVIVCSVDPPLHRFSAREYTSQSSSCCHLAMGGLCCGSHENPTWPRKDGRKVNRTITDKAAMVAFWVFIGGMVACILNGIWYGDEKRLTHGSDWEGRICGFDLAVKDLKYMMFCGSPERSGAYPKYIIGGSTACVSSCPTDASMTIDCLMPAFHNFTSYQGGAIGNIPNVETLSMTLTQSVTVQNTYPTEDWAGRFCLPKDPALRDIIVDGPWGQYYRPLVSIGGIDEAWPLLLISACTACFLGWAYLTVLSRCAGPLVFGTMILSSLLALGAGLFFLIAMLMDMDDADSLYCKLNPITSVYVGDEAKTYSIMTGIVTILIGTTMTVLTYSSLTHVDEMVGMIAASCECHSCVGFQLKIFPFVQTVVFCAIVVFFVFFGLPLVASLSVLDYSELSVNEIQIQGLQRIWKKTWIEHFQIWYYLAGVLFLLEFYIQFGHYVVAYAVTSWYFTKGTAQIIDQNKALAKANLAGKKTQVRVAGVDGNAGPRDGHIIETAGGKMLVVPVGKKGPGLGRNDAVETMFIKSTVPFGAILSGSATAFIFHIGSLAVGAPVIFIFRPFRMVSQTVSGFLKKTENAAGDHKPDKHTSAVKQCLSLVSACLEQIFGKYSKNAFTEMVLNGEDGFFGCSEAAFEFMEASGGSIAHLHGAMLLYEMFGCGCITLFCGWITMILLHALPMFSVETNPYYIEDKLTAVIASMVVAFCVAWAWMSLWNQTADVLLYCTAWNRRQEHLGHENKVPHAEILEGCSEFCPQGMRNILPPHELDPAFEHGIHAHGLGAKGAILAAMEQGQQHSATVASAHNTMTKMIG